MSFHCTCEESEAIEYTDGSMVCSVCGCVLGQLASKDDGYDCKEGMSCRSSMDKNFEGLMKFVRGICMELDFPVAVYDDTCFNLSIVLTVSKQNGKIFRRKMRKSMIGGCMNIGCKNRKIFKKEKVIAGALGIGLNYLNKAEQYCETIIEKNGAKKNIISVQDFVAYYLGDVLGIDRYDLRNDAEVFYGNMIKLRITNSYKPFTIAGLIVYFVLHKNNIDIDINTIAVTFKITRSTLIAQKRELCKILGGHYYNVLFDSGVIDGVVEKFIGGVSRKKIKKKCKIYGISLGDIDRDGYIEGECVELEDVEEESDDD